MEWLLPTLLFGSRSIYWTKFSNLIWLTKIISMCCFLYVNPVDISVEYMTTAFSGWYMISLVSVPLHETAHCVATRWGVRRRLQNKLVFIKRCIFFIQRQKLGTPGETPQNKLMHIHRHHHCPHHHPTLYIRIKKKNSCYKSTLFESQSSFYIRVQKGGLSLVYTRVKKKGGRKSGLHECQKGRHWPG